MSKEAHCIKVAEGEVRSIKGFGLDWKCRDFQYEVGQTYHIDAPIVVCESGFHACDSGDHPLSVFEFYPPGTSRYADVRQSGDIDRVGSKIASGRITIDAEIMLPDLIRRAVDWVFARCKQEGTPATGWQGAASATGTRGRVMGAEGNALFLCHRNAEGAITHVWSGIAGRNGIKPMVWYMLGADGQPQEIEP